MYLVEISGEMNEINLLKKHVFAKKESHIITHDPFNKYIQRLRDTSISLTTTYKYEHEISQRLFTCSNNHMFFFFHQIIHKCEILFQGKCEMQVYNFVAFVKNTKHYSICHYLKFEVFSKNFEEKYKGKKIKIDLKSINYFYMFL